MTATFPYGSLTPNFSQMAKALTMPEPMVNAPASPNLDAAAKAMNLTPQEKFLYQMHLQNLGMGGVPNKGGTSTLYQMSTTIDGKTYNLPTVWNGQIIDPDAPGGFATIMMNVDRVGGLDKFPSYATTEEAEQRYQKMHDFLEKDVLPEGR